MNISHKKERNLAISDKIHEHLKHYVKWNKSETNTVWYHLYVESKKPNL